jgi:hypothetical protein
LANFHPNKEYVISLLEPYTKSEISVLKSTALVAIEKLKGLNENTKQRFG